MRKISGALPKTIAWNNGDNTFLLLGTGLVLLGVDHYRPRVAYLRNRLVAAQAAGAGRRPDWSALSAADRRLRHLA